MADDVPKKKRLVVLQDRSPDASEPEPEERPPGHWVIAAAVITVLLWSLLASNAILQRTHVDGPLPLVGSNIAALLIASGTAAAATARYGVRAGRKHATYGTLAAAAFGWTLSLSAGLGEAPLSFRAATLAVLLAIAWVGGVVGYRVGSRKRGGVTRA